MLKKRRKSKYFSKRVEHLQKQKKVRNFVCFCSLIVLLFGLYFLFFSPLFLLTNLKVKNNKEIPPDLLVISLKQKVLDSNNKIYWSFLGLINKNPNILTNLILLNSQDVVSLMKIDFPQIDTIRVSKDFFKHSLEVFIEEKHPVLKVLQEGFENIFVDSQGDMFKANTVKNVVPSISFLSMPDSLLEGMDKPIIEKNVFSIEQMKYISLLSEYIFKEKKEAVKLEYNFQKQSSLILNRKDGFDIYLTINDKIIDAFKAADIYYLKEIKSRKKAIEYIDARYYPEKLFFK